MEVSSHALDLGRVLGVKFRGALFTNLGREHLDYHRTFGRYFAAKKKLFTDTPVKVRVVNVDDAYGRRLKASLKGVVTYGIKERADYQASQIWVSPSCLRFKVAGREFEAPLTGIFNVYNVLAAVAILKSLGFSWDVIAKGLKKADPVPGRFEVVRSKKDFIVVVDYAHAPLALEEALKTARELAGESKLICVFGCGGDRDRTKRPVMGEISARLADLTVVTSDNPRTEKPGAILKEILRGIPSGAKSGKNRRVFVQPDRAKAVHFAIAKAGTGDVVLIAGKGHETYQIIGERRTHFDDREEARKALAALR